MRARSVAPAPRAACAAVLLCCSATALVILPVRAAAAPTLIATRPTAEPPDGDFVAFVGGIDDSGRSLKVSGVEVVPAGERTGLVASTQSFSDWAAVTTEQSSTWRPPLAVGLVYLWVRGVPRGVLDGIHAFFQRVPSRTTVLPTVYGRMRQGRASLIAADISRLDEEVPPLEDYKPNMIDAVRLDLSDLAANPAPIKLLLLVTDGRDFADPKGQGPGDFTALGRELRKAGVTLMIVAYPPASEVPQSVVNVRELHDAAGGFLRVLDQPEDLENTLESLGQAIADLQHVHFGVPWSWRAFGTSQRVSFRLTTGGGNRLTADAGTLDVPAGSFVKVAGALTLGFVVALFFGISRWRRRAAPEEAVESDNAVLAAAHALIRRGTSPARAVEELTRTFSEDVNELVDLDPEALDDPRFPYFGTRLGRQRLQEIRDLLVKKSAVTPSLGPVVVQVLVTALAEGTAPATAAESISARAGVDEWTSFAGMGLQKLAEALRAASREQPALGTPRARGVAVGVQDALRLRAVSRPGVVVGWLVRSGGPGRRGETLRIKDERALLGTASGAQVPLAPEPGVAAEHAEILLEKGEFVLVPLAGPVSVEGKPLDGRHVLADGETIQIGRGLFVFKSAAVGNVLSDGVKRSRISARRRVG